MLGVGGLLCVSVQAVAGRCYEGERPLKCALVSGWNQEGPQCELPMKNNPRIDATKMVIIHLKSKCIFLSQSPDQLEYMEQEAIRLSEEIKAEYWAVSAKSGKMTNNRRSTYAHTHTHTHEHTNTTMSSSPSYFPGDGIKDFFFRVASLTFEANVLAELERSGCRQIGDIISKSCQSRKDSFQRSVTLISFPVLVCVPLGITDSTEKHKPTKKKANCC